MIAVFGNVDIGTAARSMLLNCGGVWHEACIEAKRYCSIREVLAALAESLAAYGVELELLPDMQNGCGLFVRIYGANLTALDFRVSELGPLLGYEKALLAGFASYRAHSSPCSCLLCGNALYDGGLKRRENTAALRSNGGAMQMQRMSCVGRRLVRLAALDRARVAAIGGIIDACRNGAGFICTTENITRTDLHRINGDCLLLPAQGQALRFTRSFGDPVMDLWDCEIDAVAGEKA